MGVSGKWIRALVGLKKSEKSHSSEKEENVGNIFFLLLFLSWVCLWWLNLLDFVEYLNQCFYIFSKLLVYSLVSSLHHKEAGLFSSNVTLSKKLAFVFALQSSGIWSDWCWICSQLVTSSFRQLTCIKHEFFPFYMRRLWLDFERFFSLLVYETICNLFPDHPCLFMSRRCNL